MIQELRIGNIVSQLYSFGFDGTKKPEWREWELDLIDIQDVQSRPEIYKPIPITEEWLVRFGFEKHQLKNELWFSIQDLAIEKTEGGFFDRETSTKIDSVHWLQNYTFFKTLQELKLNDE